MQVELIWQRDCPNVPAARQNLMKTFSMAGFPAWWREWCLDEADCPEHAREFESPSILVDGKVGFLCPPESLKGLMICRFVADRKSVV